MQNNKINFEDKHAARAHIAVSLIKNKLVNESIQHDLAIAEKMCDDLYSPFDEDIPILSKDKWNLDYFHSQISYAELIFSKERITHILEVRQYLRDQGVPELQYTPQHGKSSANDPTKYSTGSNQTTDKNKLKKIVIVGVVAVVVVAVLVKIIF